MQSNAFKVRNVKGTKDAAMNENDVDDVHFS